MKMRFQSALALVSLIGLTLGTGACGKKKSSSPPPTPFSELLVVSDGTTIMTKAVSGGTSTDLGSATVPDLPGTYDRSGTLVTITMPMSGMRTGLWVDLAFSAGTGGTATSGRYKATRIDDNTFTIDDTASGAITGGTCTRKAKTVLAATYSQSTTTVTVTYANHGLQVNDNIQLQFTSGAAIDETVKIASVPNANTFTVPAADSATNSGNVDVTVGSNYTIFQAEMHPSGKWLYVTSSYDYANGRPFGWRSGLISRFAIDWDTGALTFENAIYGEGGGSGYSMPVELKFNSDGSRLFLQDDDLDGIYMYSVDPSTGDLTVLDSQGGTSMHGVGVSADGTRVYNGTIVFPVSGDTLIAPGGGSGGNSDVIVGTTLYCADASNVVTYSLADPDAPAQIASFADNTQEPREVAVSTDGALIVSCGWDGLRSFDYDGANITPAAAAGSNEYAPDGWLTSGAVKMFRNVSIDSAGTMIATSYFTMNWSTWVQGMPPSGYALVNLAADGSLSLAHDYSGAYYARVAKFIQKP